MMSLDRYEFDSFNIAKVLLHCFYSLYRVHDALSRHLWHIYNCKVIELLTILGVRYVMGYDNPFDQS